MGLAYKVCMSLEPRMDTTSFFWMTLFVLFIYLFSGPSPTGCSTWIVFQWEHSKLRHEKVSSAPAWRWEHATSLAKTTSSPGCEEHYMISHLGCIVGCQTYTGTHTRKKNNHLLPPLRPPLKGRPLSILIACLPPRAQATFKCGSWGPGKCIDRLASPWEREPDHP